ncbi:MAG TPA: arginine deiminase-related protein, partial [Lautropia sp.]|nr:arginine deiminase-related protein [Lautropia sp.]
CFGFNPETAADNRFSSIFAAGEQTAAMALREFRGLAERLQHAGVDLLLLPDDEGCTSPDAVFPNNWVSFHSDGTLITYPMAAPSRRAERRLGSLDRLLVERGFDIRAHHDLTGHERNGRYLEGTGSLILDRPRRRAYACHSGRTHADVIADFDRVAGYSTLVFDATGADGTPLYHTNVTMSLGARWAAVCVESVAPHQRRHLLDDLEAGGRVVIEVTRGQMMSFACNILELESRSGQALVAMSSGALASLRPDQRRALETLGGELVACPIPTIEAVGGGGVRCMLAELHLPRI